jgi:hypothetical protein
VFEISSQVSPMTQTTEIALVGAGSALVGGLLGGLLSGAYQHCRDWFSRPKLQIDYKETSANKVEIAYKKDDSTDVADIYIRARVRNTGRRTAKGAQVFLTSLKEVHPSGSTTATSFHDSMPLSWAGWNFKPRDIPPASSVHFYVDLMRVSKHQPRWFFTVENLLSSHAGLENYSGTYRFQLTLTADNAKPAICEIDVTYAKDWHSLRAVPVLKS